MFYPKIMQPTHAKWEQIPPPTTPAQQEVKVLSNGLTNGYHHINGTGSSPNDSMEIEEIPRSQDQPPQPSIFSDVPAIISRNFTIVDTVYKAPPLSGAGYPGPDGHVEDPASGTTGLSNIPNELVDELPPDCRRAFEEARRTELRWTRQWGTETQSGLRGDLKIGFNGYPVLCYKVVGRMRRCVWW